MLEIKLFILVVVANGAPVVAARLLGRVYDCPLDAGMLLPDKQPLFGESKTGRGIVAALLVTLIVGQLLEIRPQISLSIAFFAMAGDLLSSFIKRRLAKPAGSMMIGLDQIPESLLPLLAVRSQLALDYQLILLLVGAFVIVELALSWLLYKLRIRRHPY